MCLHPSSPPIYLHPASPSALLLSAHYTHTRLPFSFWSFLTDLSQMLCLVVTIPTLPRSHSCFPCSYLCLPASVSGPQLYTCSDLLSSYPLSLPTSTLFHPFLCLLPGPNPLPSEACPHHRDVHQRGCLLIPYCVPGTSRGDAKFLPCWHLKKKKNQHVLGFFCLKAI